MAYPTFDTEGGGDKFLQCVDVGGDSHALAAVETATANAVQHGWFGVATHVEDDPVATPGGFTTSKAPLVLVGGARDDALSALTPAEGDAVYLRVDANGALWTHDDALDAALSGSELQVDIVSPGTAAASLGKAEDAGHSTGDVGVMALSVRQDTAAALGGTDADYQPLITDANGRLHVIVAPLPTGSNAIGKLAANTGVDIGDVDVTSIVPGTAATNLGKAEDAGHSTGDVGIMALSVRQDSAAALGGTDADYQPLITDANGRLHVLDANSAAITTAVQLIDDTVYVDDADWSDGSSKHLLVGGLYQSSPQTITDGDVGPLEVDVNGRLIVSPSTALDVSAATVTVDLGTDNDVTIDNSSIVKAEDAAHGSGDTGVMALAVRNDTLAALATADGDYAPLQVSAIGALFTVAEGVVAHDGVDVGHPVKIGGRAQAIIGAEPEEVADNDRVDGLFDRNGRLGVTAGSDYHYADINDATSGNNTILAAQAAGKRIAVWAILIVSDGTVDVRWEDGAGGTAFTGQVPLQAREGYSISAGGLVPLFVGSAATLLNLELSAAINVHGFVSYTVLED